MELSGVVVARRVVSVRFSQGGRVSWVKARVGDRVKKGQSLAGLERKPIQMKLDVELADYRRIRAEFDKLSREIPKASNDDEKTKKEIMQARLDVAVKAVERSKYELDNLSIFSPVDGVVTECRLVPGINISPASFPVVVLDVDSLALEVKASFGQVRKLGSGKKKKFKVDLGSWEGEGKFLGAGFEGKGKKTVKYPVWFGIVGEEIRVGMKGKVS